MGDTRPINRHVPQAGQRFLAGGHVFEIEHVDDWQVDDGQSVFTVRGVRGTRWALRLIAEARDGIKWAGEELPSDPQLPDV